MSVYLGVGMEPFGVAAMTTLSAGAAAGLLVALMVVATTDDRTVSQPHATPGSNQNPSALPAQGDKAYAPGTVALVR